MASVNVEKVFILFDLELNVFFISQSQFVGIEKLVEKLFILRKHFFHVFIFFGGFGQI
jgi:hypothetical protein